MDADKYHNSTFENQRPAGASNLAPCQSKDLCTREAGDAVLLVTKGLSTQRPQELESKGYRAWRTNVHECVQL